MSVPYISLVPHIPERPLSPPDAADDPDARGRIESKITRGDHDAWRYLHRDALEEIAEAVREALAMRDDRGIARTDSDRMRHIRNVVELIAEAHAEEMTG